MSCTTMKAKSVGKMDLGYSIKETASAERNSIKMVSELATLREPG